MQRSLILAATLIFGFLGSTPAEAQRRRPNQRVIVTMQVDGFAPQQGKPGTLVTIDGSGFTRKVQVLVGGRVVRPTKMGSTIISFEIPARFGDGTIVLRKRGVANDMLVGTFAVQADPVIRGFAPASGAAGTRVEIRGSDFSPDTRVTLGNLPLRIDSYAPSSLVVTIPPGASTGFFTVQNTQDTASRSHRSFRVVAPAPLIRSFTPTHGLPGTTVRVHGENLGGDIQPYFGRLVMTISRTGPNWFEATVPASAKRDQAISIRSRRGGTTSSALFKLEMPAFLSSYSPAFGSVGTRVQINGKNFLASDRVTLAGQDCPIIQLRGTQITIDIPARAQSGAFAIHRGGQVIQAATRFDVFYAPALSAMEPRQGAVGTNVRLLGNNLSNARLYLGNLEIRPTSTAPGEIRFTIPRRAQSAKLRVVTRGGQVAFGEAFRVWSFPGIKRISPTSGGEGTSITISGALLDNAGHFFLGSQELPIVSRQPNQVIVQVPRGAQSGVISWTAYGRTTISRHKFRVVVPPTISGFSPTLGAVGTRVAITGNGFNRSTRVRYGNQSVRVLQWSPTRLDIEIPRKANKSAYLSVQGEGGGASATQLFDLVAPPLVAGFRPQRGKPGSELLIFGANLGKASQVMIGEVAAPIVRVDRSGVWVRVPELASGSYNLSVQSRGLRTIARKRFSIDDWARVNDIRPMRAQVGDTVKLTGSGLANARIFFGPIEMPVIKADRRGRKLKVTVPPGCEGTRVLTIDDGGHRSPSSVSLEIIVPPPPPPPPTIKVRDHRKKKKVRGPKVRDHRRR